MKVDSEVFIKALQVSLIVGTVLVLINHSSILFGVPVTTTRLVQIILCFIVPFMVSLYSQITAGRETKSDHGHPSKDNLP